MPKKHIIAPSGSGIAAAPPLPARLLEILVALPIFAWLENSKGEILAHNRGLATPAAVIALANKRNAPDKITTFPLPPIKGCPRRMRLVALVSKARENDCLARAISALLALLLDASHPDIRHLTPQQRDIYEKLSLGHRYKEIAHNLGISHNTLLVQLTHMRKHFGDGIIPRLRRARSFRNRSSAVKGKAFRF